MGRQIAVVMTYEDEQNFLSFLKEEREIILFESYAETKESLWTLNFEQELTGHYVYNIWNKEFNWIPQYKKSVYDKFYVSNDNDAPIIEYTRSNIYKNDFGRIYWAKDFTAPDGLVYDVEKFECWYEQIVRWIKKNSKGKIKSAWITYFLPHAWDEYTNSIHQNI